MQQHRPARSAEIRSVVQTLEKEKRELAKARERLQQKLDGIVLLKVGPARAAEDPEDPAGRAGRVRPQHLRPAGGARRPLHVVPRRHRQAGFEDQPNPCKTHPKRELLLGKHPPDKFGCTPCHNGQGAAVNSRRAGARRGEVLGAPAAPRRARCRPRCIKCHANVAPAARRDRSRAASSSSRSSAATAATWSRATTTCRRSGPSLRRIGAKVDPAVAGALGQEPARVPPAGRACRTSCSAASRRRRSPRTCWTSTQGGERRVARRARPAAARHRSGRRGAGRAAARSWSTASAAAAATASRRTSRRRSSARTRTSRPTSQHRREDRRALDLPLAQEPARLLAGGAHAEPAPHRRRGARRHVVPADARRRRSRRRRR